MLEFLKRGFEKTFGAISSAKKSKKIDKWLVRLDNALLFVDKIATHNASKVSSAHFILWRHVVSNLLHDLVSHVSF